MLQHVCENWKEENAEIAKLSDIFISKAKEGSSTGEYVVCLYTAHLVEITKFFFVFAGISDIQEKMINDFRVRPRQRGISEHAQKPDRRSRSGIARIV